MFLQSNQLACFTNNSVIQTQGSQSEEDSLLGSKNNLIAQHVNP